MEKRQFGKTDMRVGVLGFGGAEIGFELARVEDVKRLLTSALDAGLNVIDTAECYLASEELRADRRSRVAPSQGFLSVHKVWPS
jgi:aryl-alcohol dehydrogenase-like predicted oxidoreductase